MQLKLREVSYYAADNARRVVCKRTLDRERVLKFNPTPKGWEAEDEELSLLIPSEEMANLQVGHFLYEMSDVEEGLIALFHEILEIT